jgi:hypothetical protein
MSSTKTAVASFFWLNEAELAKVLLESHGIAAELSDTGITSMDPLMGNAVGGIKLLVSDNQVAEAISIIKADQDEASRNYKPWCPNCDSENVVEHEAPAWFKVLSVCTLGLAGVLFAKSFRCNDCNYRWR